LEIFPMSSSQAEVINYIVDLQNFTVIGIGNMVGWGELFLKQLKEHKV